MIFRFSVKLHVKHSFVRLYSARKNAHVPLPEPWGTTLSTGLVRRMQESFHLMEVRIFLIQVIIRLLEMVMKRLGNHN
jgi:hypothetical protein